MKRNLYPILLNLKGKNCLIVGGGNVAERKLKKIYTKDAKFKVISPEFKLSLLNFIKNKKNIMKYNRKFRLDDLKKIFLVISATDDKNLNEKICEIANKKNILCNCVNTTQRNFLDMAEIKLKDINIFITSKGNNLNKVLKLKKIIENMIRR